MGKRIELTQVYRPKAKGKKPPKTKAAPPSGDLDEAAIESLMMEMRKPGVTIKPTHIIWPATAEAILAHKRAVKAAQMRRFRARQKQKGKT